MWEVQADEHLFARTREPDEIAGIYQDILLTRAADDGVHQTGQDGGLVSAMARLNSDWRTPCGATIWRRRAGAASTTRLGFAIG